MSKRSVLTFAHGDGAASSLPCSRRSRAPAAARPTEIVKWSIITAGFALGIAAGLGALGTGARRSAPPPKRSRATRRAGDIRGALILGLVLIESLVIYVLLISLILFFLPPFK